MDASVATLYTVLLASAYASEAHKITTVYICLHLKGKDCINNYKT